MSEDFFYQDSPGNGPDTHTHLPLEFHGTGLEYFKIWLVNIILSVLSLGIYSAWAKVRRKQYFYGNTTLNGASFEYLADPKNILKGRIIAFVFFVAYSLASQLYPLAGLIMSFLLMGVMPWLVVRSVSFNFRNSAYKNIRFGFDGGLWEAVKVFVLFSMTVPLTLGLSLPYVFYRQRKFIADHASYGHTGFTFYATGKDYYRLVLGALLPLIVGCLVAVGSAVSFPPITGVVVMVLYLYLFAYISVSTMNLFFNATRLDAHGFEASLSVKGYAWVVVVNTFLSVITLGLYYPWARVRTVKYKLEHLNVIARGSLDEFTAAEQERVSALGEEVGDFFDMDIGL